MRQQKKPAKMHWKEHQLLLKRLPTDTARILWLVTILQDTEHPSLTANGKRKILSLRFRKYLERQKAWSEEEEKKVVEKAKEEIKAAIKETDEVAPQKVTDLSVTCLKNFQNLQKQMDEYKEKESK